ncbi:hypothetical protein LJR225_004812 [Phenylobacterium sp. LjRoot225]|uniref:hypothetical protein n=1 Tax=Phenylobacterium sp. LjRoot225 TaxID=3342285 RepID=UPI003ECE31A5
MVGEQVIVVVPVEGGWSVQCSMTGQPVFFRSGAQAEETARKLAACIAELGQDVRVMIHARDSALVGTRRHFAP